MDSSNTKVSNILDTDNWSDALLIKDEKGNFAPLKVNKKIEDNKMSSKIDHVSEGSLAPQDDSFLPMQNINGNSQTKAELVFHPDDKAELDFFAKNLPQDDSKKYSVEKIVARIIEKQKLVLDDKNKKIFTNILYNFFRNRKSASISRDLLTNSVLIKNKKLASDIIDAILSVIKGIKNKIDAAGGLVVNQVELKAKQDMSLIQEKAKKKTENLAKDISLTKKEPVKIIEIPEAKDKVNGEAREGGLDHKSLSAQDEIKVALGELPDFEPKKEVKLEIKKEPSKVKAGLKENKKPAKGFVIPSAGEDISKKPESIKKEKIKVEEVKQKLEIKEEKTAAPKISLPKVSRPNMNQALKKPVSDVIAPVKEEQSRAVPLPPKSILTGPVQELQSFDLVGFRRLGNEVDDRIEKILDKINLLEQESYTKKAQGIAAWRDSTVYKLYLQIGIESMAAGKEVADFIAEYEMKNKETLNIEEFSAISDLNKQLRF